MRYGTLLLIGALSVTSCDSRRQPELDAALYLAALHGDLAEVDRLIGQGANVNARSVGNSDETPLHPAVDKGHVEVVRHLLRAGANPELRNRQGDRPIDFLQGERYEHDECKRLLMAAGDERRSRGGRKQ